MYTQFLYNTIQLKIIFKNNKTIVFLSKLSMILFNDV